ncbi:hypothetical protein ACVWZ6_005592 [Bradyrhizobium sp. GM6.1]
MSNDDKIPTIGTHRGVGLHDQQTPERLDVVRGDIDQVFAVVDIRELFRIAASPRWAPEARLLAAAMLEAMMAIAADERKVRPAIDLDRVRAAVAGLDSVKWRDRLYFASMLDHGPAPGEDSPIRREVPLP